jgi:arabinofuranan 3-O-arabinosyltransferase
MPMTVCKPGGTVTLAAGTHTITTDDSSGGFKVTSVSFTGTPVPQSTAPRGVTVDRWGSESRTLTVSGGRDAILNVHQNYNSGWVATVNGHQLHPVRLDGWQQGWLLPAATAAQVVTLRFTPEGPFRTTLIVGAGLALVLVVWALLPVRRRRRGRSSTDRGVDADLEVGVDVPAERAADGDPGVGSFRDGRLWLAWVVLTGAIFAISGPVAVAVPLLVGVRWLVPRRVSFLAWSALGALVLAGIAAALGTGYRIGTWIGGGSYTAQALGGLAVAALVLSLLPNPHRRRGA